MAKSDVRKKEWPALGDPNALKFESDKPYSCRFAKTRVRKDSGQIHYEVWFCKKWKCDDCAKYKIDKILERFDDMSGGAEMFSAEIEAGRWEAVQTAARRESVGWVIVKGTGWNIEADKGSGILVAEAPLSGRNWGLTPTTARKVRRGLRGRDNLRQDWCRMWKVPDEDPEVSPFLNAPALGLNYADEALRRSGVDLETGLIDGLDPFQTVERLEQVKGQITEELRRAKDARMAKRRASR